MGYSLEEVQGKHHRIFVESEFADSSEYRQFWSDLSSGRFTAGEFKRFAKDGSEVWIQASYNPILNDKGEVYKVVKYASDVTAQVQAREEAVKLRRIVEDSDAAFMMVDRDFVVTYINQATRNLLAQHQETFRKVWPNFDASKILGMCIDQFHKDPSHQRRLLSDPQKLPYKTDIQVGPLTIALNVTATYDANGVYVGNTLEWKDVTEARLQEARDADFRGQIAAIDKAQAVIEFDLDGTVISANENFLSVLGYRLEEVEGKHHSLFATKDYAESREYDEFWNTLKQGDFVGGEFQCVGKNGKEVWLQASYNPIFDVNGNPVKVVNYATDITAAKEMEIQIKATQQREQKHAKEQQHKVAELLTIVNAVAEGDLSIRMPDLGKDAIGQVAAGVGKAIESIHAALAKVRHVASTVALSSQELASASEQISSGAQEQASNLEETAASLEQITSAVKQNTDNSSQAQQLATSSRDVAESGGNVVGEAVGAMTAINIASKKIAEIIMTIDEIAFQTNLLALNAAVEAARAGEQGRGFAVVASEVRNLAQRSAGAAKEIKNLIQDSVAKVENGTELVNRSGETLQEIVTSVKRVADIVTEISAASSEQLTGIEQVNSAVSQMDRVTQTNAAQTEQMSGTSQALLSHSEELKRLVAAFRLSIDDDYAAVAGPENAGPTAPRPTQEAWTASSQEFEASGPETNDAHELDLIGVGADSDDFEEF